MHYLDHAATTPVPQEVAQAMVSVLTEHFGNPSAQYELGRQAKALTDQLVLGRGVAELFRQNRYHGLSDLLGYRRSGGVIQIVHRESPCVNSRLSEGVKCIIMGQITKRGTDL